MKIIFFLLLFVFLNLNCKDNSTSSNDPILGGEEDPGYRVLIYPAAGEPVLPGYTDDWTLLYKFIVPPKPTAGFDYKTKTVYTYGQVDFDDYGSAGNYQISDYQYNQIVPQVMIGNCLSWDSSFVPHWTLRSEWVMQAQYYWMNSDQTDYAKCGELYFVSPGEEITTLISYSAATGHMTASISRGTDTSRIVIDRPFPNDTLFASWREFLDSAQHRSSTSGPYGNAALNVETHFLDAEQMCSMLPFHIGHVAVPTVPWIPGSYSISKSGVYSCVDSLANELAILNY